MATKEELQEQYTQLDTHSLIHIVAENSGYTELAMSVAADELARRDVPKDEIRKYKRSSIPIPPEVLENYPIDITFVQKFIFYLLGIPFRFRWYIYNPDFLSHGFVLKSQQARYYSVLGFLFFIGTIISSVCFPSIGWIAWPAGFLLSYFFDIGYNRQRQIDFLKQKIDGGRNPVDEFS